MKLDAEALPSARQPPRRARWPVLVAAVGIVALLQWFMRFPTLAPHNTSKCPREEPLFPIRNRALWQELADLHATDEFLQRAVSGLSEAVKIPTETFDDMAPVGEDTRWLTRAPFVDYLGQAYPLINAHLGLQKVNTYGLVYTWQGTDESLKPLLLMGHYDVVPVAPLSVDQWTFPPYSGHFDGKYVWGRGSIDDKSGVIGIMTAIEVLLEKNFKPTQTVVLSFGFDEESGGEQGARYLALALLERFGPNSFAMILDEGAGYIEQFGAVFAAPGVAEKGFANVNIEVQTPGGHSSVPPEHTSIGMLAAMIVHLENNPPVPVLELDMPAFVMMQCLAVHAPDMPAPLKRALLDADKSEKALKTVQAMVSQDRELRAIVGTTQAVDMISGGVKSNALPEQAAAVVNHRISTSSSVNETVMRDAKLVQEVAARFNLSVSAYGEQLTSVGVLASGSVELSTSQTLEPAPITPSDAAPFKALSGTIRATYKAARTRAGASSSEKDQEIYVIPGLLVGNTDTRFMWQLSDQIFRYDHDLMSVDGLDGVHTVNERMNAGSFVEMITFFTTLILNVDEVVLE
ncbi:hypothetical protein C8F01DRAFT_377331 [Mycena amicta]|nr:hypothetical protein C8F01DRAFT_377331 [Mycena amicta]